MKGRASGPTYPFLISVPHGGLEIPGIVQNRIAISTKQVRYYCDPATRALYDFQGRVAASISSPISRMVVDLNRPPYHLAPRYPDGAIKSLTVEGEPVYLEGRFPEIELARHLMMTYYFPYHEAIDRMIDDHAVQFAMDCNSMLPVGPSRQKDAGKKRPLICLGNNGDALGNPKSGSLVTCPPSWIRSLAGHFRQEFTAEGAVAVNTPFAGGFIPISHYWHRGVPWIQIELSRELYEEADTPIGVGVEYDTGRVDDLRERVWKAVTTFWDTRESAGQNGK